MTPVEQPSAQLVTMSTLLFDIQSPSGYLDPQLDMPFLGNEDLEFPVQNNISYINMNTNLTLDLSNLSYGDEHGALSATQQQNRTTGQKSSQCETFNLIVYGVILGLSCLLGISGNTLSIFVLQKDKSNVVASFLLQVLAVADNLVLVMSFIFLSLIYGIIPYTSGTQATRHILPYILKFVHPLAYMAQTLTIWMTVLLAINRFIAVCRPFHATTLCTIRKARYQVIAVVAFSVLFNFPRFFQFEIVKKTRDRDGEIETYTSYKVTSIGERSLFGIIYTNAIYSFLVLLLPLVFLAYLNTRLAIELKNMRQRRNSMSATPAPRDQNITLVMVIIIVIFLICHTPDRILQGIKSFWMPKETGCYSAFQNYTAVSNMLITINSSTNFLVYYFFRKRFRTFLVLCLLCRDRQSRKYRLSSLSTNGLQQVTLMTSLANFAGGSVSNLHGSRLSLPRLSTYTISNSNSCVSINKLGVSNNSAANNATSLAAVRERLLAPPVVTNGHRNSR